MKPARGRDVRPRYAFAAGRISRIPSGSRLAAPSGCRQLKSRIFEIALLVDAAKLRRIVIPRREATEGPVEAISDEDQRIQSITIFPAFSFRRIRPKASAARSGG